ncbi:hypothetical protein QWZ13_13130 [Reinekea marina]|nr:hypothetical protein [Reinekea marina]MDN3649856.1 hypothetical protein [Reinekea marina]
MRFTRQKHVLQRLIYQFDLTLDKRHCLRIRIFVRHFIDDLT